MIAADYAWFRNYRRGSLHEMYCLTLVQGLSPSEFLEQVGATSQGESNGFDAFEQRDMEFQEAQDDYGDFMFVGATPTTGHDGSWTLVVELNGIVGTNNRLMAPVSNGRQVVSHYRNINALAYFSWWENGELRTQFENPSQRSGSTPDALLDLISGLGMTEETSDPAAGFLALAEELTGVRITPELLESAVYSTGIVEVPTTEWSEFVIDLRDDNGEGLYKVVTREDVETGQARQASASSSQQRTRDISAWAEKNGIKINERRRIPASVIALYEDAERREP
ncbi:DUF6461 domain-containing protein [Spirillospora albida]|uniref:DUF6461 domain-containing protein n=1 Tax=Spirillospora albida TaxID=58123 RepID=UPI00068B2CD5|nr:histone-like nucleoid-structuring protein Lsr2 [Spirillospora albida]